MTTDRHSGTGAPSIYDDLGVSRVINARSYSTKLGGCRLPPAVLDAMRAAAESCIRMEELQQAASRVIAEVTGAEAGMVTSGASASLTLAAAACLARLDVSKMNRLPDVAEMPNEIVVQRAHRNDYDHALRIAGVRLMEAGYAYYTFPYDVESLISERTVALFYLATAVVPGVRLQEFVAIAHRHQLPVIVDAAAALPPASNLRSFIATGADLVAFSGGKHIQGPQASGILCGRKELILSALLQHQDMDVFPETWPLRNLIGDGRLLSPPHHGIGRGFKVGKEEIVGLLSALRAYQTRDHDAELAAWRNSIELVVREVSGIAGVSAQCVSDGDLVPSARVSIDPSVLGYGAQDVINQLQEGNPPIAVFETYAAAGTIVFYPEALAEGEAQLIGKRLREILVHPKR
jgi:D-glucosaminate-6-phosphate ammonia-lyase